METTIFYMYSSKTIKQHRYFRESKTFSATLSYLRGGLGRVIIKVTDERFHKKWSSNLRQIF